MGAERQKGKLIRAQCHWVSTAPEEGACARLETSKAAPGEATENVLKSQRGVSLLQLHFYFLLSPATHSLAGT